uniref:Polygalacturonase n=1 Tax=Aegilops tauschii TaxID=37682 RepID=M8D5L3_AEGTA
MRTSLYADDAAVFVAPFKQDIDNLAAILRGFGEGGKGYAKSISFTDIKFTNVDHPVVINQFYVDRHDVPNMGAVALSNITYTNLRGTSRYKTAVEFDCSESGSCTNIHVNSVAITAAYGGETVARCQNAQGDTSGYVYPKIPCLR